MKPTIPAPRREASPGLPADCSCGMPETASKQSIARGWKRLAVLADGVGPMTLRSGEVLIGEGQRSESAFLVDEGVLALTKSFPGKRRQGVGFRFANDLVHHRLCDAPSQVMVQAVTPARLRRIPCSALRALRDNDRDVCRLLLELAEEEIAAQQQQLLLVGCANKEERLAAFLCDLLARPKAAPGRSRELVLPMHRREIADYLGLSTETVSRGFTRLAKEGIFALSSPSRIRILDKSALESRAAGRTPGPRRESKEAKA